MNTKELEMFKQVAEQGSYAEVARHLDCDPSLVSRTIAGLETELGFRLFHRSTRSMSLTEAGELYLAKVTPALEELHLAEDAAKQLSKSPEGVLRLSASVAFGQVMLIPLLPKFRETFPKLKLDLMLTDTRVDMVSERIDLAIRLGPLDGADLIATKLMPTRYRVVASPKWQADNSDTKIPTDLSHKACLLFSLPHYRDTWLFKDVPGGVSAVPVSGQLTVSSVLALREAAIAGEGPALLADWLVDDALTSGKLVDLFPSYQVTAMEFETAAWLLYPSRSFVPYKVRAVMDFLKHEIAGK